MLPRDVLLKSLKFRSDVSIPPSVALDLRHAFILDLAALNSLQALTTSEQDLLLDTYEYLHEKFFTYFPFHFGKTSCYIYLSNITHSMFWEVVDPYLKRLTAKTGLDYDAEANELHRREPYEGDYDVIVGALIFITWGDRVLNNDAVLGIKG